MDQRALVDQLRRGDHDAFAVLARGGVPRLDTAARLIPRDAELARDAVQEAMVRAWRDIPGLRDPDRFDAWLHRLTVRACIDAARHRRRRVREVELTPMTGIPIPGGSAVRPTVTSSSTHSGSWSRTCGRSWSCTTTLT